MASVDKSHWVIMKNTKIHERKILLDKNADIRRKIESTSFTDAQKKTFKQDLKQNLNKIKTLDDQINGVESNISSKATNDILQTDTVRGRSQTREPKHRYASPSPPQRSPRSVSSSSSRKKNHPTDDDTLGIMQRLLEMYKAENARLKRRLYAESRRYGEEIYQLMSKKPHKENDDIFRLRLQKADLSIHHRELLEENKHLREMNYNLRLETEKKFSSSIKALEAEKQSLTTMLQNKNREIIKFTLEVDDMKHLIDNLLDEKQRFRNEIDYLNDRINSQESEYKEKLREVEDEANYLQKEYDDMKAAYQRACLNEETLKWKLNELTRKNQENKTSALKKMTQNQQIKDLQSMIEDRDLEEKRLRSKISKQEQEYETKLREYEVKNEELKSKLTKEMIQCESLQASIRQHKQKRDQHSIAVEKAYEQNANLSERLKIETEDKAKLQRENKRLKTEIDSTRMEKDDWGRGISERLANLQREYNNLQEAYNRERRNVETLKLEENKMKRTFEEMQRRNEALERDVKENEASTLTQIKLSQQIIQLQSNIKENDLVKESLRNNVDDLEKENRELQLRIRKQEQEYETTLWEYEVKNEELRSKLTKEMEQYESQQASIRQHKQKSDQYSIAVEKAYEQNANLSERLKIETEDKAKLQRENKRLKTEIDSTRMEKDDWGRGISERLANLQREYNNLQEAYNRERRNVETLKLEENKMKRTFEEMQRRNEALEKNAKENEASTLTQIKLSQQTQQIIQLQSNIKEKNQVQESLRNNVVDLEKENRELQLRLKQLEKKHKNEADSLKPNYTDLEKKAKLLHEENEKLLRNATKERNKVENLQTDLDNEKRRSEELRERIEDIERLWQTDHMYKSEAKVQKTNHTDLEKKVKQLQEESERHLQKESHERNRAENLQSKLHAEERLTVELHAKIEELEKERMKFSEKQDAMRKQVSDEKDKEQIRIKRLEAFHKKETETIQQKLAELQKKFYLIQEERDNLRESEETERNIGEKAQLELEDAKREKEKLQERIKKLERQITEVPKLDPYLSGENRQLKEEAERLRKEVKNAIQKDTENDENIRRYERQVEALKRERNQAISEKESALTRLSALAGDRLRDNNAAIADLSDENRPINLGEKFSELYDNQWTDAIEKLEKLMSERDAIQKLLQMIKDIYDVCRKLAKDQLDEIAKAFGFEERKEKLKRLKDFRKSMASENIGDIKKKVDDLCVSKTFSRETSDCTSYISRSVELCWYMCIQDPPVILEFNATRGQVFDDKIYRHFTKSGKTIDYMVWPVMYLHSNGPLLQKGVVQPM